MQQLLHEIANGTTTLVDTPEKILSQLPWRRPKRTNEDVQKLLRDLQIAHWLAAAVVEREYGECDWGRIERYWPDRSQ